MPDTVSPVQLARAREKERQLAEWLRAQGSVLLGFSGGVDSAYLGCVAVDALGPSNTLAVIGRSPSYPEEQWATARQVAELAGLPVLEIDTHELQDPRYLANPANRCYFCKTELWARLAAVARERDIATILDGMNADDLADYRPGAQAARELGVRSPLAELGLTKAEIRLLSHERGLPTWDKPSSPCLSSRVPYGTPVTIARLREVETAERALRELGITGDLRVRYHGELARVELSREELSLWLQPARREALRRAVCAAGFTRVAIDLHGFRSGSLNILGGVYAA
ncbi:MAG TPA: ATP-dependent sacrificial sulfur transferase LarE [Gemmatimonadaceae bacterium]|nr:ATP-dependent sacrificial sulfur transferase LarE [Gemmatimonadaceae bacterium]